MYNNDWPVSGTIMYNLNYNSNSVQLSGPYTRWATFFDAIIRFTFTPTPLHTRTHAHTHARAHTHTYTHTHARTHAHTHEHTHQVSN